MQRAWTARNDHQRVERINMVRGEDKRALWRNILFPERMDLKFQRNDTAHSRAHDIVPSPFKGRGKVKLHFLSHLKAILRRSPKRGRQILDVGCWILDVRQRCRNIAVKFLRAKSRQIHGRFVNRPYKIGFLKSCADPLRFKYLLSIIHYLLSIILSFIYCPLLF